MSEHNSPEIWRTITDFPNYAVSNFGRVQRIVSCNASKSGTILSPRPNSQGYVCVGLYINGRCIKKLAHRLVLEMFVGKALDFMECNHKDGNRQNNHLSNLEWVTPQENAHHSFDVLERKCYGRPRLTNEQTEQIRSLHQSGHTQTELAHRYKVSITTIWNVVHHYRRDAFELSGKPMPKGKRLTDDQIHSMRASYPELCNLKELAAIHHVSVTTVWRVVHRYQNSNVT